MLAAVTSSAFASPEKFAVGSLISRKGLRERYR